MLRLWDGTAQARTVLACVQPLIDRLGDVRQPEALDIDGIGLVAGDPGLSVFEDRLARAWPAGFDPTDANRFDAAPGCRQLPPRTASATDGGDSPRTEPRMPDTPTPDELAAREVFAELARVRERAQEAGGMRAVRAARLVPLTLQQEHLERQLAALRAQAAPFAARRDECDRRCDETIRALYAEHRRLVGGAEHDVSLAVFYASGTGAWTDGSSDEQPLRMEMLAEMYEHHLDERMPDETCRAFAAQLRRDARELAGHVEALRPFRARLQMLAHTYAALARTAQAELAKLAA